MSDPLAFMEARRLAVEPVPLRTRAGRAGHLTVAAVLDQFSEGSFAPECDLVPLTMRDWFAELVTAQPDLLLVESAWRGYRNTWWNTVMRRGPEIMGILDWCRERGVPTAFWNKEDPVHFRTFLTLAREFDAVFTTDVDCVPLYRSALGHDNVHFLPFAAQTAATNPVEVFDRIDGTAFAGAYYARYPDRTADLDRLSTTLRSQGTFHIYDRNFGKDDPDYAFPDEYQDSIICGLDPSQIAVAYKGYTANLNLNSVKQSQSMFARRVFELGAGGTAVVSNFARGLRNMFGALVLCTDSAEELQRRQAALADLPNGPERLRVATLRKVLEQHTYAERLAFVAEQAGVPLPDAAAPRPLLLAAPRGDAEREAVRAASARQTWRDHELLLVDDESDLAAALGRAAGLGCTHVGVLDPADWYGPEYLGDLLATFGWADVEAAGHGRRWAVRDGVTVRVEGTPPWACGDLDLSRALTVVRGWDDVPVAWRDGSVVGAVTGLAVGTVGYCEDGAHAGDDLLEPVLDLPGHHGFSLAEMRSWSREAPVPEDTPADSDLDLTWLLDGIAGTGSVTLGTTPEGRHELTSTLETGKHEYLYSTLRRRVAELRGPEETLYLDAGPGLDITGVLVWFDAGGKRVGHTMLAVGKNTPLDLPAGAASAQVGLRVLGPGRASLERASLHPVHQAPAPVLTRTGNVLVSNIYPAYDNLYRNGFVHSRVRGYREAGHPFDVLVVDGRPAPTRYREFEDVDVAIASPAALEQTLRAGRVRNLFVHVLQPWTWRAIKNHPEVESVRVWVHGFEVHPFHRRAFNHTTPEDIARAKQLSDERMTFWEEVLTDLPDNVHLVFVSQYLADCVREDVGVDLPADRYSVIPNPIDETIFRFTEKAPELRKRILSVRPYASPTYANDLAVQAVLELKDRPGFDDLHFTFCGDGPLFDSTLAPLRDLPNVEIRRGFLTHGQIAELHRDHGVFLVPTRMDTQGVSRDEAMMSGLVPVTSAVAAVPEFVDETCAFLAPAEDFVALADGIQALADDPDLFARMSVAAHENAAARAGAAVIRRELELLAP